MRRDKCKRLLRAVVRAESEWGEVRELEARIWLHLGGCGGARETHLDIEGIEQEMAQLFVGRNPVKCEGSVVVVESKNVRGWRLVIVLGEDLGCHGSGVRRVYFSREKLVVRLPCRRY